MTTVSTLNTAITDIAAELNLAKADVVLLERLKGAADRVKSLTAQLTSLTADRNKLAKAEAKTFEEARFKGLSDIRVIDTTPDEGVLRTGFTISYTRVAWSDEAGQSVPQPVTTTGFEGLPDTVYAFLVEKHPDRIPAKIMELAPGDPTAAFNRYFQGLSRGFIRT